MNWLKRIFGVRTEKCENYKVVNTVKEEKLIEEVKEDLYCCSICQRKLSKKDF